VSEGDVNNREAHKRINRPEYESVKCVVAGEVDDHAKRMGSPVVIIPRAIRIITAYHVKAPGMLRRKMQ